MRDLSLDEFSEGMGKRQRRSDSIKSITKAEKRQRENREGLKKIFVGSDP